MLLFSNSLTHAQHIFLLLLIAYVVYACWICTERRCCRLSSPNCAALGRDRGVLAQKKKNPICSRCQVWSEKISCWTQRWTKCKRLESWLIEWMEAIAEKSASRDLTSLTCCAGSFPLLWGGQWEPGGTGLKKDTDATHPATLERQQPTRRYR